MKREDLLTHTFLELADSLVDDFDLVELMVVLTERAAEISGSAAAGLLLLDAHDTLRFVAATNDAMELVEVFQVQSDEGPCRDCCRTGAAVVAEDLSDFASRWPRFVPVASNAGYLGAHAFPLRLRGQVLGALGVFRATGDGLTSEDSSVIQAFADVATIAVLQARSVSENQTLASQLQHALDIRVVIEQAKGVLAERADIDMGEAFQRIRGHARSERRRVHDIALEIIDGTAAAEIFSS